MEHCKKRTSHLNQYHLQLNSPSLVFQVCNDSVMLLQNISIWYLTSLSPIYAFTFIFCLLCFFFCQIFSMVKKYLSFIVIPILHCPISVKDKNVFQYYIESTLSTLSTANLQNTVNIECIFHHYVPTHPNTITTYITQIKYAL